jgi:hypothetical protein
MEAPPPNRGLIKLAALVEVSKRAPMRRRAGARRSTLLVVQDGGHEPVGRDGIQQVRDEALKGRIPVRGLLAKRLDNRGIEFDPDQRTLTEAGLPMHTHRRYSRSKADARGEPSSGLMADSISRLGPRALP